MREIEDREDFFILGIDPNDDSLDLSISKGKDLHNPNSSLDLSVLAERGQVILSLSYIYKYMYV